MTESITLEQYKEHLRTGKMPLIGARPAKPPEQPAQPKTSKMRNTPLVIDDIRFDSIAEGAYYLYLVNQVEVGAVSHFLRQVSMECGGGVRYRLDFLVVIPAIDGCHRLEYVDVKGRMTDLYKLKKKQIESRYPIRINEVYRKDIPDSYLKAAKQHHELAVALNNS